MPIPAHASAQTQSRLTCIQLEVNCRQPERVGLPAGPLGTWSAARDYEEADMLPEPTLTFTLPSLHDDTVLDCRVYHPFSLNPSPNAPEWKRHAAILAHPYAPLGGCYDDPVVDMTGEALLRAGYLLGTFNFRGASKSAGKTSWTGRAEQSDYMSFVGFMVYYAHFLDPFSSLEQNATLLPPGAAPEPRVTEAPVFLCAGYSYGAMITSRIPPLDHILPLFAEPLDTSAAADIRLRAQHLAEQQNSWLSSARALRSGASPGRNMRIGGDEGEQRRSHDGRRSQSPHSEDKLRRGVSELLAKTKARGSSFMSSRSARSHRSSQHEGSESKASPKSPVSPVYHTEQQERHLPAVADLMSMRPAYVLISPPQGAVNHLLTLPLFHAKTESGNDQQAAEVKLVQNPTLAVFGDRDGFNTVHRYRSWAKRLTDMDGSQFQAVEVPGAGHFYTEERVLYVLRDAVGDFAGALLETGIR